jgi:hypothetical protein
LWFAIVTRLRGNNVNVNVKRKVRRRGPRIVQTVGCDVVSLLRADLAEMKNVRVVSHGSVVGIAMPTG